MHLGFRGLELAFFVIGFRGQLGLFERVQNDPCCAFSLNEYDDFAGLDAFPAASLTRLAIHSTLHWVCELNDLTSPFPWSRSP